MSSNAPFNISTFVLTDTPLILISILNLEVMHDLTAS